MTIDRGSEIAERIFGAIKDNDIDAINRGLQDFASIGWRMSVVYRFITRDNKKISCIMTKDNELLFLVNGKFDLDSHKRYINMFIEARKDKKILDEHFKHREEMSSGEVKWLTSTDPRDILEADVLQKVLKK
jgi:hypothetical protein